MWTVLFGTALLLLPSTRAINEFTVSYTGVGQKTGEFLMYEIKGYRPDDAATKVYPVFVYLMGTKDTFYSPVDKRILEFMANQGYVAATIDYPNQDLCMTICQEAEACTISMDPYVETLTTMDKAKSVKLAIDVLCNDLVGADCNKGVALSGFQQGAFISLLIPGILGKANPYKITGALLMGVGHIKPTLWMPDHNCVTNTAVSVAGLPSPKRRYINGEHDIFNVDQALDVFSGYVCREGAFQEAPIDCFQPGDGGGYYIVAESEFTQNDRDLLNPADGHRMAGHNFFGSEKHNIADSTIYPAFSEGAGPWALKQSFAWLAKTAQIEFYSPPKIPATPRPVAQKPGPSQPTPKPTGACRAAYQVATPKAKMCVPCAGLEIVSEDRCKFNLTQCQSVAPGGSCEITCARPYFGKSTIATCPKGNSNPAQQLDWTAPICECPDPDRDYLELSKMGYKKAYTGGWECADGFAPVDGLGPRKRCGCNEEHGLDGCKQLVECKPPVLDNCSYDTTGCESVQPGQTCTIRCKTENGMSPGFTVASCNDTNTDPLRELYWFPLRCTLEKCPDSTTEPGYELTSEGWKCADGYAGEVVKECAKGPDWNNGCGAVTDLTGCKKIVNCEYPDLITPHPTLDPFDKCRYGVLGCNIPHNSTCEVTCMAPYEGTSTIAYCPYQNTNGPTGLIWTRPTCRILDCAEPSAVESGYVKVGSTVGGVDTYKCAASYTGTPSKLCQESDHAGCPAQPVGIQPKLKGCTQLTPCMGAPGASECQHQTADCASVVPGGTCTILCKPPFVGNGTTGQCDIYNTNSSGLSWNPDLVSCIAGTSCPDPVVLEEGYVRGDDGMECATGYSGTVEKKCFQESCTTYSRVSGCFKELPCMPYKNTGRDMCMQNISSACAAVKPGESCQVGCITGYKGAPGLMRCPKGNVLPDTMLEGAGPTCECPDPQSTFGYKRIPGINSRWICDNGNLGKPIKECNPQPPACDVITTLKGCDPPVPCAAAPFVDTDPRTGTLGGVLSFGPAQVGFDIHEDWVWNYRVFWADRCNNVLAEVNVDPIEIPKGSTAPPPGQQCVDVGGSWARENDSDITTFHQTGCAFNVNEVRFVENNSLRSLDGQGTVAGNKLYLFGLKATVEGIPGLIKWEDGHVWVAKARPLKLLRAVGTGETMLQVESTVGFYADHYVEIRFAGNKEIHMIVEIEGDNLVIAAPGISAGFPVNSDVLKDKHICCLDDVYKVDIPKGSRIPKDAVKFLVFATIPNGMEAAGGVGEGWGGPKMTAGGLAAIGREIDFEDNGTAIAQTGDASRWNHMARSISHLFPFFIILVTSFNSGT